MTWTSFHRRSEVLRDVIAAADARRDGVLPLEVPGVAEAYGGDLDLFGALLLKWHTRLAGRVERELAAEPLDLREAVVRAWQETAAELPGVRAVIDAGRDLAEDPALRAALATAEHREYVLLAVMAGLASGPGARAEALGAALARKARVAMPPAGLPSEQPPTGGGGERRSLLGRLKAALAA